MTKITLTNISDFTPSAVTAINSNSATLITAIDNTLSRDGTTPNSMGADLDMNSHFILNLNDLDMNGKHIRNLPVAVLPGDPITFNQVGLLVGPQGPPGNNGTNGTNGATGATGPRGADSGVQYMYATSTTMADPGTGNMRFNSATFSSITAMAASYFTGDTGNPDASNFLKTWDDSTNLPHRGTIIVRKLGAVQNYIVFDIVGTTTDNGNWLQFDVVVLSTSGTIANTDPCSVAFTRTGDKGTAGTGTGDMLAANNLSDVASIVTSRTNLGVPGLTTTNTFSALQTFSGDVTITSSAASAFAPNLKLVNTNASSDTCFKIYHANDDGWKISCGGSASNLLIFAYTTDDSVFSAKLIMNSAGDAAFSSTTTSTSKTTGSLTTAGGLGVLGDVRMGGALYVNGNGTGTLPTNTLALYNTTAGPSLTVPSGYHLFNVNTDNTYGAYLSFYWLNIDGSTGLALGTRAGGVNTDLIMCQALSGVSQVKVLAASSSISPTTGALTVAGGLGVVGDIFGGGKISAAATAAGANGFYFGSTKILGLGASGFYTTLNDPAGTNMVQFGNTSDPITYWSQTATRWRDRAGTTIQMILDSTSLNINNTTTSTSSVTGSLITAGGLGVAGAGYFGGNLFISTNTSPTLTFGISGNVNASLYAQGSGVFAFYSAGGNQIFQLAPTASSGIVNYLQLVANTTANNPYFAAQGTDANVGITFLNKGASSVFNWSISSVAVLANLSLTGLSIVPTTASTSTTTGALVVSGGLGVAGQVNAGQAYTHNGVVVASSTINSQTVSYTAVLADAGSTIEISNGSANNFTIPLNSSVAYPIGTTMTIVQMGAGQTTVVATGGVTIRTTTGLKISGQYGGATIYKRATDEWVIIGNLTT